MDSIFNQLVGVTPTVPELLGPYTEGSLYAAASQKFRETFPGTWQLTARPHQWVIGNDTLTVSYRADTREYAIIEYTVKNLIAEIKDYMVDGIGVTIPVLHVEYEQPMFKYPFLQIEQMLNDRGLYQ